MSIKPMSQKNPYWLDENRYRELKYYCLQYPSWKKLYLELTGLGDHSYNLVDIKKTGHGDPTARRAILMEQYDKKMHLVEEAAEKTDLDLARYILRGVTEGLAYNQLVNKMDIPCSRDTYYRHYHKFFWTLSRLKD